MKHHYKLFLFIAIVFSVSARLRATPTFFFDYYTVQEGLSNSSVKAIAQDQSGYIWMGTKDGLNRFDGLNFKVFRSNLSKDNRLFNNDVTCMNADSVGNLWIGTFSGISLFNTSKQEFVNLAEQFPHQILPSGIVTDIYIQNSTKVWVSTKKGLYLLHPSLQKTERVIKDLNVLSMSVNDQRSLIVEVFEKGLALVDVNNRSVDYLTRNYAGRPIMQEIFRDGKKRVWLGSSTGKLFLFSPENRKLIPVPLITPNHVTIENEEIHCIEEYNDSTLLIGTNGGIFVFDPVSLKGRAYLKSSSKLGSLNQDRIMSIYKDRQGGLWIGTFTHGVNYHNSHRNQYKYYSWGYKDENQGVLGKIVESNGTLWMGSEKGLSTFHCASGKVAYYDAHALVAKSSSPKETKIVFQEDQQNVWLFLLDQGLFVFDFNSKQIIRKIGTASSAQVRSVAKDHVGNYWIAEEQLSVLNLTTGLFNYNLKTNSNAVTKFTLSQCLLRDSQNSIWVGTRSDGVYRYNYLKKGGVDCISTAYRLNTVPGKNISILFEDSKQRLWIGTYGEGLCYYDLNHRSMKVYTEKNGLQNNRICGIEEDRSTGCIWVSTSTGLSKISGDGRRIMNYSFATGFSLGEVAQFSFIKASDGNFYIGGSNGLLSFNPRTFVTNPYQPKVVINSVRSLGVEGQDNVDLNTPHSLGHVVLNHAQSSFVVTFSALNYLYPKQNRYAYKVEGVNKEWIQLGNRNEVNFMNMSEGDYVLCVKGCNNDGVWSADYTRLKIKVLPPFWRSWWAKFFYLVMFIFILYFIIQYLYIKNSFKYQLRIEQIEKDNIEKNYQLKLKLFTNFSHELRTPLTLIIDPLSVLQREKEIPERLKNTLGLAYKNANRMLLLVNQLLDFRKMESNAMQLKVTHIDLQEFVDEIFAAFQSYMDNKQIYLDQSIEPGIDDVWFDKLLMEKLIFNLLSNAIKNSKSGDRIQLRVYHEHEKLMISLKDQGIGIAAEEIGKIFEPFYQVNQGDTGGISGSGIGLNLSKAIVELHQGKIWAESELGKGATFYVQLPLGKDHLTTNDFLEERSEDELYHSTTNQSLVEDISVSKHEKEDRKTILVVEDDADIRSYIQHIMSSTYDVLGADHGADGFKVAVETIPDLIISDVMMPVMSGIELCQKLKSDLCTAHIPVLLLTARTMTEQIQEGYEYGADEYMLKPFDSQLLLVRVGNLIQSREKLRKIFKMNFTLPAVEKLEVSTDDKFLKKLFEFVERNIDNSDLRIEDFSEEVGVSRAQLFRKLKVLTDITPNKLLLQIRMKTALKLLQENEYPITEIAYKVGFSDPAYFGKCFKLEYNMTPKTYALQFTSSSKSFESE
jgi:signal transduction histidine kinase/ligand-binding sensor domain-containing protein/DNA-binding response OmpR family regulator